MVFPCRHIFYPGTPTAFFNIIFFFNIKIYVAHILEQVFRSLLHTNNSAGAATIIPKQYARIQLVLKSHMYIYSHSAAINISKNCDINMIYISQAMCYFSRTYTYLNVQPEGVFSAVFIFFSFKMAPLQFVSNGKAKP